MTDEPSPKKLFTVEEANQRLPLVRAIVHDIVEQYRELSERRDRLAVIQQRRGDGNASSTMHSEEVEQVERELEADEKRLQEFVRELGELGVEFKDPVQGLVDFPSRLEGREVYLCWKLGEPEVQYWHDLDAGFAGRSLRVR